MKLLPISSIQISPDRQRRAFEPAALVELSNSIQSNGLFSPIIIREIAGQQILVAGERRLRAISLLHDMNETFSCGGNPVPFNHIPTISLGELTPLAAEEAEYEENVRRESLTWQERAAAESRLHALRCRQDSFHTVRDTTEEIHGRGDGSYHESVRKNLIVAQHLHDPDVMGAKTANDALKVLKRKETTAKNLELAATVGLTFSAHSHTLINGDAIEWMKACPEGTFDVILTDPPYGIDAHKFNDGAGRLGEREHTYDDSEEYFTTLMSSFFPEAFRVTKPQAHLYLFCDIDRFSWLRFQAEEAGFWVHRTPIIRIFADGGSRVPWPEHGPRRSWEMILYAVKGKRLTNFIAPDAFTIPFTDQRFDFGAQKPIAVYTELLRRSIRPGDLILDTFAGTGTILPAAHELKCLATAVEMDASRYGVCLKRLEELK